MIIHLYVIAPGHGTHYWNNEISIPVSPPQPNPQHPKNTPHILYSRPWKVKSQPEGGPHIGPKHVVVSLLYY